MPPRGKASAKWHWMFNPDGVKNPAALRPGFAECLKIRLITGWILFFSLARIGGDLPARTGGNCPRGEKNNLVIC
jgi:hypothetical protein